LNRQVLADVMIERLTVMSSVWEIGANCRIVRNGWCQPWQLESAN